MKYNSKLKDRIEKMMIANRHTIFCNNQYYIYVGKKPITVGPKGKENIFIQEGDLFATNFEIKSKDTHDSYPLWSEKGERSVTFSFSDIQSRLEFFVPLDVNKVSELFIL